MSASEIPVPYDAIIDNLGGASASQAVKTLTSMMEKSGDGGSYLAVVIAQRLIAGGSSQARFQGLRMLKARMDELPVVTDLAIEVTRPPTTEEAARMNKPIREAHLANRVFSISLLASSDTVAARERLYELVSDDEQNVRDAAMEAIPKVQTPAPPSEAGSLVLNVFRDGDEQQEAVDSLAKLELATHKLRDLGDLNEGQVAIIDELMLPRIQELKILFDMRPANGDDQLVARKKAFGTGGILIGSAMAAAQGVDGLAEASEPYQAVGNAAGALHSLLESLPDLIRRSQSPRTGESDGVQERE